MAELVLITRDSPDPKEYKRFDIMMPFCDCRILYMYAVTICKKVRGDKIGPYQRMDHLWKQVWSERMSRYRNERVAKKAIMRYDLVNGGDPKRFNNIQDEKTGEHMDVEQYFEYRLDGGKKYIYIDKGKEFYYSGNRMPTLTILTDLWTELETLHTEKKEDWTRVRFSEEEQRLFLSVSVDDFDLETAGSYRTPEYDNTNPDKPVIIKRRLFKLDYDLISEIDSTKADNQSLEYDARDLIDLIRADTIVEKTQ